MVSFKLSCIKSSPWQCSSASRAEAEQQGRSTAWRPFLLLLYEDFVPSHSTVLAQAQSQGRLVPTQGQELPADADFRSLLQSARQWQMSSKMNPLKQEYSTIPLSPEQNCNLQTVMVEQVLFN